MSIGEAPSKMFFRGSVYPKRRISESTSSGAFSDRGREKTILRAGASRKKRRAKRATALPESSEGGEQRGGGPRVAEPSSGAGDPARVAATPAAAERSAGRAPPERSG